MDEFSLFPFTHQLKSKKRICLFFDAKGGLISEDSLTLVPLPKKSAKSHPGVENLNKFFTVKGGNSNFLLRGEIWHFLLAMGPNLKYLLRLSYLYVLSFRHQLQYANSLVSYTRFFKIAEGIDVYFHAIFSLSSKQTHHFS